MHKHLIFVTAWTALAFGQPAVFKAQCVACHGASPQGGLDLRTHEGALRGGKSGAAVVAGMAAKSLLMDKIVSGQMPPGPKKLNDAEIDQVRSWINEIAATAPVAHVREQDVRAILQARCAACHGGGEKKGGLDLRTLASRLKGGKSGPALIPGKPEESLLYKRIVAGEMPPAREAKVVAVELPTESETEKIRAWIAAGAPGPEEIKKPADEIVRDSDRKHWAFQPSVRPRTPAVRNATLVKNPIDAFLLAKLEAKGLSYSPEAERPALMRRLYLDLTGLPPSPADVRAYLNDRSPDAYEKLVDRLLASPRYGERWGQHWLDLAGYADSEGFGQDDGVRQYAWRYRDYVIRSLNNDKPYTQFLTEQIAGDEISDDWKKIKGAASQDLIDRLAATGFLRTAPDPTNAAERGLIGERMNILAEELEVLTSATMGLTVGCARCHNHKYDPIPQRDYYRLSAILQSAYDPYEWKTPNKREYAMGLESELAEAAKINEPLETEQKKLRDEIAKIAAPYRAKEDPKISDRDLAAKYPEFQTKTRDLQMQLDTLRGKMRPKPHVRVLADNAEHSLPFLLRRGESTGFGDPVDAGTPALFDYPGIEPYRVAAPYAGTSGKRLALAKWLTQPRHPLTSRVAMNQLWMRHFGRGIVPTVANFGRAGLKPSNQELLDWLAVEFVEGGWTMKRMHRIMVTSRAYRQSSKEEEKIGAIDPDNAMVSRMPLRRMDADTLWDSLVGASGRLDETAFGKPSPVEVKDDKEVVVKPDPKGYRRNVYVLHRRQTPVSLMDSFDQPAMTPNCTERRMSNVATQALHMMNGTMTWDLAKAMAGRVIDESDGDRAKIVENAYLRAYSRFPSRAEVETGMSAIEQFRKGWPEKLSADNESGPRTLMAQWMAVANFTHALMNSAEFSYID
ncbi:MAG: DUF1553 domain-containing protein [Acidobacteria bacterium]|nr:DUF1553 domain-containing protein [Acidobacteriota bacterium]